MAIDPICGMMVEPATAAGRFDYKGQAYYFCATSCLERFRADPEKALAKASPGPLPFSTARKPLPMMMPAAPAVGSEQIGRAHV
jgi:Cu+-exporting ATPase